MRCIVYWGTQRNCMSNKNVLPDLWDNIKGWWVGRGAHSYIDFWSSGSSAQLTYILSEYTTVQKFGVTQTILCLPWKLTFIYQMNWTYSQDIDKVRNNDYYLKY